MGDSHLILNGTKFIVCGLFSFSISEAGEVSLNFGTEGESFFKQRSITRYLRAGIIGQVQIFGAAIGRVLGEFWMRDRTAAWEFKSEFRIHFQRASELGSFPVSFDPGAVGFHFQSGLTKRRTVGAESFLIFLISGVYGNEGMRFHGVNNKVIEVSFIIGGIGDKEGAMAEAVDAFKFSNESLSRISIGFIVRESKFHQGDAFFRDDDMSSVAPEEYEIVLFRIYLLVGEIT